MKIHYNTFQIISHCFTINIYVRHGYGIMYVSNYNTKINKVTNIVKNDINFIKIS